MNFGVLNGFELGAAGRFELFFHVDWPARSMSRYNAYRILVSKRGIFEFSCELHTNPRAMPVEQAFSHEPVGMTLEIS